MWLAKPGATSVRVLERSGQATTWAELSVLGGLEVLHLLFSHSNLQEQPPSTLAIGAHVVTAMSNQNGTKMFDLTPALSEYLSQPQASTTVTIPLTFTAAVSGIITVYPPHIEYDV